MARSENVGFQQFYGLWFPYLLQTYLFTYKKHQIIFGKYGSANPRITNLEHVGKLVCRVFLKAKTQFESKDAYLARHKIDKN